MICSSVSRAFFIVRPLHGPDSNRRWRKNPVAGQAEFGEVVVEGGPGPSHHDAAQRVHLHVFARLAERRAFVAALAVYAKGIAAERIAAFAEAMVEVPVPEAPKVETFETPAKAEKPAPTAKGDAVTPNA